MGAQDKTEQVLRDIYILLAGSEAYRGEAGRIIVDKKELILLLNRLNTCIYEIMEEHELTVQSRNAAERQVRRRSDEIVADAGQMAEDVYAASILYTDEALRNVQGIIQETCDAMRGIYEKMDDALKKEKQKVSRDQSELKGNLEDLKDTEKYLHLIEERNRQIAREKAKKEKEPQESSAYAAVRPEIKVNQDYFDKMGISLETEFAEEIPQEEKREAAPEVVVNLDAEYFKWKENGKEGQSSGKKQDRKGGRKFF